jgi:hypothetical protein
MEAKDISAMLADQGGRCAACKTADPGDGWVVDRSRETGRVRGILCRQCKTALTLANDDPETLRGWARVACGQPANERERRLIELRALEARGLVVRRQLPDGSAQLYFPQPNHPDVLAFNARMTLH